VVYVVIIVLEIVAAVSRIIIIADTTTASDTTDFNSITNRTRTSIQTSNLSLHSMIVITIHIQHTSIQF